MFGIKKQIIKSMIKLEIVSNQPGKLKIYSPQINQVDEAYRVYEHFAVEAVKLLQGIDNVSVDYEKGIATITYDKNKLSSQLICRWIDQIIDIAIDNRDFIKANWEKDIDYVWQTMEPVLKKSLNKLN